MTERAWQRVIVLAAIIVGALASGCTTDGARYHRTYIVREPVMIHVADWRTVRDAYQSMGVQVVASPYGFAVVGKRELWVMADGMRPDMKTLGHEIWHLPELGGLGWHDPSRKSP